MLHLAVEILDAAGAAPAGPLGLDQFGAAFAALGEEGRGDLARVLDLVVMVVRIAAAGADLAEEAAERDFGARVVAGLLDVDRRRFGFDRRDRARSGSARDRARGGG